MSTKVEQVPHHTQSSVTANPSTAAPATGSKISMFVKKSGFVIPKNKLSGSLVPILRGKKGSSTTSEESTKQVQRRTKWGPDLTQDTAVRKGRALAYQTRVDQITQQLGLRNLETGDNQDSAAAAFRIQEASSEQQLESEDSECLEIERREAIGEILKLNPSYKAPADYKPLLKEAKVPIPIKEYPGYNFIGLFFGPTNDTQKRLEKETGARIQVYGTKVDNGEKVEVTSDGSETRDAYEELHVCVSADTYEKVDAALALIELLVTPVSVNPASVSTTSMIASGDNVHIVGQSQGTPAASISQGVIQPIPGSAQAPQPNDFQQYAGAWFPIGAAQAPAIPSQDFTAPANPSAPVNNPVQVSSSPLNPSTMPSLFGPRPVGTGGAGLFHQNRSVVPSGPQAQPFSHPYMPQPPPRNPFMPVSQPTASNPNFTTTPRLSGNQPTLTGPPQIVRPGMSSLPQSASPATFSNQTMTSAQGSAGWSQPLLSTPSPTGLGHVMPLQQGHPPMAGSGANTRNVSPMPQQSALQFAGSAVNHRMNAPPLNAMSHTQIGHPSAGSAATASVIQSSNIAPIQPGISQGSIPASAPNLVPGSTPVISPLASNSRPLPPMSGFPGSGGINPIRPLFNVPPQQPSSSDFTFQPHRPQHPVSQVAQRPSVQPIQTHSNQPMKPPQGSQALSFQPAMHNHPSPIMQGFSRPQVGNMMSQPRAEPPINLISSTAHPGPPRHGAFPNATAASPGAVSLQPRNFNSVPAHVTSRGLNPRGSGPAQIQQNYPLPVARPQGGFVAPPNHQFNSNVSFSPAGRPVSGSSGAHQVYDPFLPTSASLNPQLSNNRMKMEKQENDPEYEDLMASVGVK